MTHFDNFARADTLAGSISTGPQGQGYDLYSDFLLTPDPFGRIVNNRYVMPAPDIVGNRASYAMNTANGRVLRVGAVIEYNSNTETTVGPYGYVWTIILSTRKSRFTDEMLHFMGTHQSWGLEIWSPDGSRRTIASGTFPTPNANGQRGVVELTFNTTTSVTVKVPGQSMIVNDAGLAVFDSARYLVLEHFVNGPTANVQRYPAWYYQVEGAPAADPALYAPFESAVR
ncbi:MAG: hypothetical protein V4459_00235 [Pseudomonadota bacterium]